MDREMSVQAAEKLRDMTTGEGAKAQPTAFDEIIDRIKNGTERVLSSSSRLEIIGTRIMGTLPETESDEKDAVRTQPDGTLDHAFLALNRLDGSLARLEAASLRLERL